MLLMWQHDIKKSLLSNRWRNNVILRSFSFLQITRFVDVTAWSWETQLLYIINRLSIYSILHDFVLKGTYLQSYPLFPFIWLTVISFVLKGTYLQSPNCIRQKTCNIRLIQETTINLYNSHNIQFPRYFSELQASLYL